MKKAYLLAAVMLCAHVAFAEQDTTGWYVGGGLGKLDTKLQPEDFDFTSNQDGFAVNAIGGYRFTPWFGLEARVALSNDLSDDNSLEYAGFFYASALPTFLLRVNEHFTPFAQAGLALVGYAEEYDDDSLFDDEEFAWGGVVPHFAVGAEFALAHSVNMRVGYEWLDGELEYDDDDDFGSYDLDLDTEIKQFYVNVFYQF